MHMLLKNGEQFTSDKSMGYSNMTGTNNSIGSSRVLIEISVF